MVELESGEKDGLERKYLLIIFLELHVLSADESYIWKVIF